MEAEQPQGRIRPESYAYVVSCLTNASLLTSFLA